MILKDVLFQTCFYVGSVKCTAVFMKVFWVMLYLLVCTLYQIVLLFEKMYCDSYCQTLNYDASWSGWTVPLLGTWLYLYKIYLLGNLCVREVVIFFYFQIKQIPIMLIINAAFLLKRQSWLWWSEVEINKKICEKWAHVGNTQTPLKCL